MCFAVAAERNHLSGLDLPNGKDSSLDVIDSSIPEELAVTVRVLGPCLSRHSSLFCRKENTENGKCRFSLCCCNELFSQRESNKF